MEQTRLQYNPKDQPVSWKYVNRTSSYIPRFIHIHASHELCFVSSACQFEVYSGGRTATVEGPALIIHRSYCYHELLSIAPDREYKSFVVHFLPETVALPAPLQSWDCIIFPLSDRETEIFCRYFALIPEEPLDRQVLAIGLILSRTLEHFQERRFHGLKAVSSYVFDLLRYISEHPEEKLTIDSLSAQFHVSPSKLKQDFAALTGTSVGKFLIHQRLLLARSLLKTPIPLGQLALQCGFSSQSHFISAFRAHYGITPGAYRKEDHHD